MAVKNKRAAGSLALGVTVAVIFFGHPSNGWNVILGAVLSLLLIYAFNDYPPRGADSFQRFVRWLFLAFVCGSISVGWGWCWWQRIIVSPSRVSFQGYPDETFNFSVKNGLADDVYDVQIPFLIGYNKHFEDKLSAKVTSNGDPPQRIYDDYNYCYGKGPDVHKSLPNEQEVLIVRIRHLPPFGVGNFSVKYTGGEKLETQSGTPNFIDDPYSYSPMQTTVGVRGDYRICKYAISTDGLMGK
jgi:hypothetical protein